MMACVRLIEGCGYVSKPIDCRMNADGRIKWQMPVRHSAPPRLSPDGRCVVCGVTLGEGTDVGLPFSAFCSTWCYGAYLSPDMPTSRFIQAFVASRDGREACGRSLDAEFAEGQK